MTAGAATAIWCLSNLASWQRYRRALEAPAAVQERLLLEHVRRNAGTVFGRAHGFEDVRCVADYQRRVPLMDYEDYDPFVRRIARGEPGVLTAEPVRRLAVTSGSTAGPKLIPYTDALQAEYTRGVGPWIVDLYRRTPRLAGGPAYWSITPRLPAPPVPDGAIPVGFEEDSRYLGGLAHRLVAGDHGGQRAPLHVRRALDPEGFQERGCHVYRLHEAVPPHPAAPIPGSQTNRGMRATSS